MEQDQELKHFCKLCNKSFSSGKVLGGHMRSHRIQNSTKSGKRCKTMSVSMATSSEINGYSLRENPKKSCKFSPSNGENNPNPNQQENQNKCKVCGKGFDSSKALFGHMRHHSGKRKKLIHCKECDKEFESLKAFTSHMKTHSESSGMDNICQSVRRKRSSRTRCKLVSNPSSSDLNDSSSFYSIEPEDEELAICLLMLSRGVENWGSFNFANESLGNDEEIFICNGYDSYGLENEKPRMKSNSCFTDSMDIFGKKRKIGFEVYDSGFESDEERKVKLEFPAGRYYAEVESEMPKLNDESELVFCDTKITDFVEEIGLKSVKKLRPRKKAKFKTFDSQKEISSNNMMFPIPCNNGKLIQIKTVSEIDDNCDLKDEYGEMGLTGYEVEESKRHQCAVCFKVFASGQALGGHKRAHVIKALEKTENAIGFNVDHSDACDENCPKGLEEDGIDDDGFKAWWDENGLKQGQLLGLIS